MGLLRHITASCRLRRSSGSAQIASASLRQLRQLRQLANRYSSLCTKLFYRKKEMRMNEPIDDLTEINNLFEAITKRKHWKKIRQEILRVIFMNAQNDVLKIKTYRQWSSIKLLQRLRIFSEWFKIVENNFILFARDYSGIQCDITCSEGTHGH